MRRECRALVAAFTFLTRLPVGGFIVHDQTDLPRSSAYFPLVGVAVGAIGALVFAGALVLWSPFVAIVLSSIATVLATGAFHEDALADSLDGFGGGWTKEQVLAIMKDSRVGSYALIGMILTVLLKVSTLLNIHGDVVEARMNVSRALHVARPVSAALMAGHVLGRLSSLWLIVSADYVRADDSTARPSAGRPFIAGISAARILFATILSLGVVGAALQWVASVVILCTMAVTIVARTYFKRRIGGITGDAVGAANQVAEIVTYLAVAASTTVAAS
ncbi:MAG: adenosylcobinamide-GDP ribazoletransferase [Gemmatimonas sp.]